ncbi:hypothetical protein MASR1M74_03690 [Lentimicrobium sp.]
MKKNIIGLDKEATPKLIEKLNDLLSNYEIFYQNTRGFHWNIKGPKFFELHAKFEELYTDLQVKIDEIAERVLTLGGTLYILLPNILKYRKSNRLKMQPMATPVYNTYWMPLPFY